MASIRPDMTPNPLIIVGCGKGKQDQPCPAADLYTGSYIRCAVRWARSVTTPDRLLILSAKYGLIPGTQVIAPYHASWSNGGFAKEHGATEPTIPLAHLREQVISLLPPGPVILLAGAIYHRNLFNASRGQVQPYNPFATLARQRFRDARLGYQASLLNEYHGRLPI